MTDAVLILCLGLVLLGVVPAARTLDASKWRRELLAFRLRMPAGLKVEDVARWLGAVVAEGGSRFRLLDAPPVGLETVATSVGIATYLLVSEPRRVAVLASLRAALPGVRVEDAPNYLLDQVTARAAAELRLTSLRRPLAFERAEATATAYLAALQPLAAGELVRTQWLFTGSLVPHPATLATEQDELWPLLNASSRDREAIRAERLKHSEPLLRACCRVAVSSTTKGQALRSLDRVVGTLRIMNAPGVQVQRRMLSWRWIAARLTNRAVPLLIWPLLLNAREAAGLVGLPVGDVHLPGLHLGAARQLPPAVNMPSVGTIIGASTYPGMTGRMLALKTSDRLRHSWIVGPTGVGKSTLLANCILQDMAAGRGVVVLDPKGDLITDLLDRVPQERRDDVLLIDPSATDRPVGVNVLDIGQSEHARELAADHLVYLMANLWRTSWGPRTSDVVRNALLTLTHTSAADGSRFTLVELPELLLNPAFRKFVTAQASTPEVVKHFWAAYELMSDGERAQVIGPSLNKLRQFTTRTSLRLMLGQSQGVMLNTIFTQRRVVLVNLAKGVLGTETTALVGSLLMAGLWQATLARVAIPHEQRHPVMFYLDEFQDFLRLPVDLADMLSQARGLGVGLVLAHQYLGQLTEGVKTAILGTARTQISFQVEYDDARTLAQRFAPLTADDLSGLAAYEIAMRPCVDGKTLKPVTVRTLPLPAVTTDGAALARASQDRFGVARHEVEAALRARSQPGHQPRRRLGHVEREERS